MISELFQYGGVIYCLLLLFGIAITTIWAVREDRLGPPLGWAGLTLFIVTGFSSYDPHTIEFVMGVFCYIIIGIIYAVYRWMVIVHEVRVFVREVCDYQDDPEKLRQMVTENFQPSDDDIGLPPDPASFRTRITLWLTLWPCFTMFWFFATLHEWIWACIGRLLKRIAECIYAKN